MPFKKRLLCSNITLILFAGLFLATAPKSADAQLPVFSCRPSNSGDGWICDDADGNPPTNTANSSNRYDSDRAVLPVAPSEPATVSIEIESFDELATEVADPISPIPAPSAVSNISVSQDSSAEVEVRAALANLSTLIVGSTQLDWVPREEMTEKQIEALPLNCCGAYVDPLTGIVDLSAAPAQAETLFNATEGLEQINQSLISIDGDVLVQQGYRSIQNNTSTSIDRDSNTVLMDGDVIFREPGILLRGSSAFIDNSQSLNRVESAQYVLHDYGAHGIAESITYNGVSGLVSIENGEFSRCEPESNFWHFRADSIVLDQEQGRGYAKAVSLRIKNIPIFYYPFTLPFPLGNARASGLLAPSTGSTRSGGFDFELPYYFNLAPNYDATLSPRLISDRGVLTSGEFRYLSSWSINTLNASSLSGDKLYDPATADILGSDSPPRENRWFVGLEHSGALGRNWTSFVDYNAVSDEDYFYDLGSNGLNVTSRTHLNRQARLNYNSQYLRAGLNAQRIQIIDPFVTESNLSRPFDRLPQFYFESNTYLLGGLRVGLAGEVTSFDRDLNDALLTNTQLENGALINGDRVNLEPEISWSTESPGWFLRAKAKYKHMSYKLQNQALGILEDPEVGIGVYSADAGLVFERDMSRGNGWSQTLEPRLFYLFSEFEDQSDLPLFDTSELSFSFNQLFRDDRFSGGDRIADTDQITFALSSRILDPQGKERARISLGQIQYFADRLVNINNPLQTWLPRYSPLTNRSALAGEFAYSFGDNWRLNTDVQWNGDAQEVQEGSFQLRYQGDADHLFNISYRYRNLVDSPNFILPPGIDPRIKQSDISSVWPINANWKLLARWNYDHSNNRNLESFAGVEYNNCCATIRLIGREWVDEDELFLPNIEPNSGIFVQVILNGLGNLTGGGLSSLLSDGIWGFREPEL